MMTKTVFNFNQTAEEAAAAFGATLEDVYVFSHFTIKEAENNFNRQVERGLLVSACSITKFDANGKPLTLPSVIILPPAAKAF